MITRTDKIITLFSTVHDRKQIKVALLTCGFLFLAVYTDHRITSGLWTCLEQFAAALLFVIWWIGLHYSSPPFCLFFIRVLNTRFRTKRREFAGSDSLPACLVFLYTGEIFLHIIHGPQNQGNSLVNGLRLYVQHGLCSCSCQASCLLNDVGHRIALIQEPELQRNRVR